MILFEYAITFSETPTGKVTNVSHCHILAKNVRDANLKMKVLVYLKRLRGKWTDRLEIMCVNSTSRGWR